MHARIIWRRLRIVLSFSLNFSFCHNEKPFSFDQNENTATFTENLKLFQWFEMFHSFIEDGLIYYTDLILGLTPPKKIESPAVCGSVLMAIFSYLHLSEQLSENLEILPVSMRQQL
jgi:hypothetical protein